MLILGFLGMQFDAAVEFVANSSLLFRFALAILCTITKKVEKIRFYLKNLNKLCMHLTNLRYVIQIIEG